MYNAEFFCGLILPSGTIYKETKIRFKKGHLRNTLMGMVVWRGMAYFGVVKYGYGIPPDGCFERNRSKSLDRGGVHLICGLLQLVHLSLFLNIAIIVKIVKVEVKKETLCRFFLLHILYFFHRGGERGLGLGGKCGLIYNPHRSDPPGTLPMSECPTDRDHKRMAHQTKPNHYSHMQIFKLVQTHFF